MKQFTHFFLLSGILLFGCSSPRESITNMKCESLTEPIAVDSQSPRFSWTYTGSAGQDFIEAGYEIEIATCPDSLSEGVRPAVLQPFTDYCWRVRAWNADHSRELLSPVARFSTGPLSSADWTGVWISDAAGKDDPSVPMLRKEFNANGNIAYARLYVSAAAYAVVTLNGEKVAGASRLEPGYTAYDKRNLFCTYDVTSLVKEGSNCIGAVLGNGFYNEIQPVSVWYFEKAAWRGRAKMIAELHIVYADGSRQIVPTDSSWKTCSDGPYITTNIYAGDVYDARKEFPGWDCPGFDDCRWAQATAYGAPSPLLKSQMMQSIAGTRRFTPVSVKSWGDTCYVFDFGENMAGVCEISVEGEAGTRLTLDHAEIQLEDGTLEYKNINCYFTPVPGYDFQRDVYILRGGEREVWSPSFVYHGFRYAEVRTDRPMKLNADNITAIAVHTDVASAGEFHCSNQTLNTVWEMARRTYLNNLHSIFTDCPHREKNGWTADNFLTTELALLNFDMAPYFLNKWPGDVIDNIRPDGRISGIMPDWGWGYDDWIGPVWDSSIFTIAELVYDYTGVDDHIRALWPVYKRYLEYLSTREGADGLPTYGIGDWVYLNVATPTEFTTPCFYYKDYCVMARFAGLVGEDPAPYLAKAQAIRNAVNAKWFDEKANLYANGSQAAQGIALYFGLVPEGREQAVADNLARSIVENDYFVEFGSMGSKTVPRMLTRYGHVDIAYRLAAKEESPNWGGWIKKGMTTLCETWVLRPDWKDSSLDHAFLGDIAAWYVSDLAGINPDKSAPGFANIVIAPHFPGGLDSAAASYDSIRGTVSSAWERKGDTVVLEIDVPVGCTATLNLSGCPSRNLKAGHHKVQIDN